MLKFKRKNTLEEKEKCLEKMSKEIEKINNLNQRRFWEVKKLNNIVFKSETHEIVETNMTLVPLNNSINKHEKNIIKQFKKMERLENSKFCLEERKQREAIKSQEFEKLKHVRINEPSIYHDGYYGIVFDTVLKTGEKLKGSWNKSYKIQVNKEPSCSYQDRKINECKEVLSKINI